MNIAIVGTGYVGLVTGACLAKLGHKVTCVDTNEEKIAALKNGVIPIYEPGLSDIITECNGKNLWFTTSLPDIINDMAVVFIAVGTPPDENGSADLKYVLQVAETIGKSLTSEDIVVVTKSTVPVGTSDKVKATIDTELNKRGVKSNVHMASNPEFLKEGCAIEDFMHPDRIVIGASDSYAKLNMANVYMFHGLDSNNIVFTDIRSSELIKYASNAMLATRISFMNEIANLCDELGANVDEVKTGIGLDTRIGSKFLNAGCGYGGSCFPKDVKALIKTASEHGVKMNVIDAVERANEEQKHILIKKLLKALSYTLSGATITVLGLAFKPETDDMREATSLVLIDDLLSYGATVNVYDPIAMEECRRRIGDKVNYFYNPYDAAEGSSAIVLVTEWDEFRSLEFNTLGQKVKNKLFLDGRNFFKRKYIEDKKFKYIGIGR